LKTKIIFCELKQSVAQQQRRLFSLTCLVIMNLGRTFCISLLQTDWNARSYGIH
jgi:hypothetical protein